jgi:D-3-phosphoglycerate dehydrogenase
MYKILVTDKLPDSALSIIQKDANFSLTVATSLMPEELVAQIADYHGIIVRSATKVTAEVMRAGANLKVIGRAGSGVDNIDVKEAQIHNIEVLNTPGSNSQAVAELTIGLLFALSRELPRAVASLKEHRWEKASLVGTEVTGKTIGLVGFGQIGQKVGKMAAGLGMKVLVYKRSPVFRSPAYEYELVSLETLLKKSDFVSIHLPKTDNTKGMIGANEIRLMRPDAYLVNCARGGIVNEKELQDALNDNLIAGAALDVFDQEPPEDFTLIDHPKVIATPHIGAASLESQERVGTDIVESVMEYLKAKYLFING